ncbi:hypothetical protein UYO_1710 [Lachnospiraceae bacterium JC7]|nr:hypothetical protein UYO_1710 [Lachnospiraceae bacterium JC7]
MAGNIINIPKRKALDYLNEMLEEKSFKEITDQIFEVVFLGKDTTTDGYDIFYYCRAFNIISFGIEHNVNNIMHDYVVEHDSKLVYRSFVKVVSRFPKGIPNDTPLFSQLLDAQLKQDLPKEEDEENEAPSILGVFNKLFKKPRSED